ncbi:MAG: malto-oligosyltrehalose trehalohydrolase [Deltaproteobacteria bacterium]|nr:malto-oligosyltrehalose trehalohydrolase [Deltaproteobacteria bacterium]
MPAKQASTSLAHMSYEQAAQGAFPNGEGTIFKVWAPHADWLAVVVEGGPTVPLARLPEGWFEGTLAGIGPGARYSYELPGGRRRPDPASRLQEDSVHGPSTVIDLGYSWTDQSWRGVSLERLVFYEIHVGTFSPEGTLEEIIPRLGELRELGVTALQLMPVAAFDGPHGWGYDGVMPYAVHAPYGGPRALQRLVNAAHAQGLAVFMDVVYNHLGPSGNYLREFGPYFTDRHQTPWGEAVNYDGAGVGPVREFFIDSALAWVRDFHVDGLRLDAIHGIRDDSPRHFVAELNERVLALGQRLERQVHVIAESDLNDPVVVQRASEGGWGLAAQWSDDFHHALHALLTGERDGYYADFGDVEDLAKAYTEAFVLTGQHSVFRQRAHGRSAVGLPGRRFVVAAQNHDQIGNRPLGDRLAASLPPEALRLAAAVTVFSPFLPLLFMGEEYAEPAPFQYFTSFSDPELGRSISEGRRAEFGRFHWAGVQVPAPQASQTFERSRIDFARGQAEPGASMRRFYRAALSLRRALPALAEDRQDRVSATLFPPHRVLVIRRKAELSQALLVLNFAPERACVQAPEGRWRVELDSWDPTFAARNRWALQGVAERIELGPWHAALLVEVP